MNVFFGKTLNDFYSSLSQSKMFYLSSITSYEYTNINAILRGNWNYESNGLLNADVESKYRTLANNVRKTITKFPKCYVNFIAYRGVSLNYFSKYGITSLEQLHHMKDQFIYEEAFTSTSVIRETSYFGKDFKNGINYNVEMKFLISKDTQDGVLLLGNDLSCYVGENEFLINSGSLSKVIDVIIDYEKNTAQLLVALIPKRMWDTYQQTNIKENTEKPRSY